MGANMPYLATVIANEFIVLARASGKTLTPLKLQKLVYFAHGWYLALTGNALISDRVQAWQYGPVIPSIYHEFKDVGNGPINDLSSELVNIGGLRFASKATLDNFPVNEERQHAKDIVAKVFEIYGGYSAAKLSNATHQTGTPWQQVYKDGERKITIPNELIRAYFKELENAAAQ